MRRILLALVAPAILAGCTDPDGGGFGFQRGEAGLEPYFQEYREIVAGPHAKLFDVPVDASLNLVNVTVQLDSRTNGLPVPEASPAQLEVRLLDPAGVAVREAVLDTRTPTVSLVAEDLAPGLYKVEIEGVGFSQDLDGQTYGSGYVVTVDVAYA